MAPQPSSTGVNCLTTRTSADPDRNEVVFIFIFCRLHPVPSHHHGVFYGGHNDRRRLLIGTAGHIRIQQDVGVGRVYTLQAVRCHQIGEARG